VEFLFFVLWCIPKFSIPQVWFIVDHKVPLPAALPVLPFVMPILLPAPSGFHILVLLPAVSGLQCDLVMIPAPSGSLIPVLFAAVLFLLPAPGGFHVLAHLLLVR
jgi:hypothetical protein